MKIIEKLKKIIKKEKISRSWKKLYKTAFNEIKDKDQKIEELENEVIKLESQLDQDVQSENIIRLEREVSHYRQVKHEMREEIRKKDSKISELKEKLLNYQSNEIEFKSNDI